MTWPWDGWLSEWKRDPNSLNKGWLSDQPNNVWGFQVTWLEAPGDLERFFSREVSDFVRFCPEYVPLWIFSLTCKVQKSRKTGLCRIGLQRCCTTRDEEDRGGEERTGDLTRPHPKWWFGKGNPLISGKPRLVKYYNLARSMGCVDLQTHFPSKNQQYHSW